MAEPATLQTKPYPSLQGRIVARPTVNAVLAPSVLAVVTLRRHRPADVCRSASSEIAPSHAFTTPVARQSSSLYLMDASR